MFTFAHVNLNVMNLEESLAFYQQALGLHVSTQKRPDDNAFILTYLTDDAKQFYLELTWLRNRNVPYNLGDNETHIAFTAKDFDKAYALHREMGCICFENPEMGIYFISDPDGYWLEIVPEK